MLALLALLIVYCIKTEAFVQGIPIIFESSTHLSQPLFKYLL